MSENGSQDRFRGVLIGLAAGDALGAPLEFGPPRPAHDLLREMIGGGTFDWKPGEWTDDTQMALCITKSLRSCNHVDPDDIADRFVAWLESRPPDVGNHTRAVLSIIRKGVPWEEATRQLQAQNPGSAGNGSLMRTAPLALFAAAQATEQVVEWSCTVSRITHAHVDCQWACAALNVAIVHLLRGESREDAVDASIAACANGSDAVRERLERAREPQNRISPSGHVLATLEVAFWSLLHTNAFEEAVVEVVNRGDDADTVGAVTGALAGAYYGLEAIPLRWRQALHRYQDLVRYADDLHRIAAPDVPAMEFSCIVPDRVYMGRNPLSRYDVERLVEEAGITHILDLREAWEYAPPRRGEEALNSLVERGILRAHIPVRDMGALTPADLDACIAFMEETLSAPDARLYLHCRAGRERSGSVAVAWYAHKHGIGYEAALSRLQQIRPSLCPLPAQEHALRVWLNSTDSSA